MKFRISLAIVVTLALGLGGAWSGDAAHAQTPGAEEELLGLPAFDEEWRPWLVHSLIVGAAHTIGIPEREVVLGLRHGASLREIAERHGVGPFELARGILDHERHFLWRLVNADEITRATAVRVMYFLTEHIRAIINWHLPPAP